MHGTTAEVDENQAAEGFCGGFGDDRGDLSSDEHCKPVTRMGCNQEKRSITCSEWLRAFLAWVLANISSDMHKTLDCNQPSAYRTHSKNVVRSDLTVLLQNLRQR
jgi:hypothetical protein